MTMKKGDCFLAAARYVLAHHGSRLVHGVATGRGPIAGIVHLHAWVERGETCIEVANGKHIELPKPFYYAIGNIKKTRTYTWRDVIQETVLTGHYGPWDKELSDECGT